MRVSGTRDNVSAARVVTFISSLLMLALSKLMSTEYLVGIMWL